MTTLDLAGWRVALTCAPVALAEAVAARYALFATDGSPLVTANIVQEPATADIAGLPPGPVALDVAVRRAETSYQFDSADFDGQIDLGAGEAALTLHTSAPLDSVEYFLRILYALLAFHQDGLLVHAAALLADARVSLFVGQSGSGKSTVVTLSPFALSLGDDLVLLRPTGDSWDAFGTPFWNLTTIDRQGQTARGPVAAIYKLVQDADVYLEPLSPAAAAAELVSNCPVVNGVAPCLPDLMARCRALAGVVPVRRLHFREDPAFWDLIRADVDMRFGRGDAFPTESP